MYWKGLVNVPVVYHKSVYQLSVSLYVVQGSSCPCSTTPKTATTQSFPHKINKHTVPGASPQQYSTQANSLITPFLSVTVPHLSRALPHWSIPSLILSGQKYWRENWQPWWQWRLAFCDCHELFMDRSAGCKWNHSHWKTGRWIFHGTDQLPWIIHFLRSAQGWYGF